jgi:hypothetical protein
MKITNLDIDNSVEISLDGYGTEKVESEKFLKKIYEMAKGLSTQIDRNADIDVVPDKITADADTLSDNIMAASANRKSLNIYLK